VRKLGAPRLALFHHGELQSRLLELEPERELEQLDRFDGELLEQALRELAAAFTEAKIGPPESALNAVSVRKKRPPSSQ
jgi:hypothetical protein